MESYIPDLRQYAVPFLLRLERPEAIRAIENALYEKTFKGVMDFIATYIYRIPVRGLVRLLAPTRITPNAVTAMSVLCSFAAIPLFATGWIWTAFLVAYTFVICDSLDGKLARMTIRLSKRAGQIDHGTSTPCEACYYLAWTWHFSGGHLTSWPAVAGMLLFGFFCLDKITTGTFSRTFHRSLFDYQAWDARFHLIAGRRTINLAIMTVGYALQAPITALVITMVWMGITMSWHMFRFAWHARHTVRREPVA
jgi:phosphatidylglycerophosphate synthase